MQNTISKTAEIALFSEKEGGSAAELTPSHMQELSPDQLMLAGGGDTVVFWG
jgi:hypothetical protein